MVAVTKHVALLDLSVRCAPDFLSSHGLVCQALSVMLCRAVRRRGAGSRRGAARGSRGIRRGARNRGRRRVAGGSECSEAGSSVVAVPLREAASFTEVSDGVGVGNQ